MKIGINLVNADVMRPRAFEPAVHGFLDTVRDGHPEVPLLVVGALYCPIHENNPEPRSFDVDALSEGQIRFCASSHPTDTTLGRLTLSIIRDQLVDIGSARMADDPHLHYLDGHDLYGTDDVAEHPLPDNLHPDAATHHMIAERFARLAFSTHGPLTPPLPPTGSIEWS